MPRRLRIAYVTLSDPTDRRAWSGTDFAIARALERHCGEVIAIGPLGVDARRRRRRLSTRLARVIGRDLRLDQASGLLDRLARDARRRIEASDCDVVVAVAQSPLAARLDLQVPLVLISDATAAAMRGYYDEFSQLSTTRFTALDHDEQRAIGKAAALVFPSTWAATSAIEDYGADPSTVHVIAFGANLDDPPRREDVLDGPPTDECRLLFVGRQWERKGGDIAVATLGALRSRGIDASLTIVGSTPPPPIDEHVAVLATLDANVANDAGRLRDAFADAHVLILPTRAECFGVVLCEAGAFGVPAVATRTGGTPSIIVPGLNGALVPEGQDGEAFADAIAEMIADPVTYRQLRATSRDEYDRRLNWDHFGSSMAAVIAGVTGGR
jgi:glycosyltransferase involved in cell wall biosynthesis